MSTNSQAGQKPQVNSGGASKRDVPVSVSTDAIQIEGDRVVVNDPDLVRALQERQERDSGGEQDPAMNEQKIGGTDRSAQESQ